METQTPGLQPHQQRVVDEKSDLDSKRARLTQFLKGDIFRSLPADEQQRLNRQASIMADYSAVLAERIVHFNS